MNRIDQIIAACRQLATEIEEVELLTPPDLMPIRHDFARWYAENQPAIFRVFDRKMSHLAHLQIVQKTPEVHEPRFVAVGIFQAFVKVVYLATIGVPVADTRCVRDATAVSVRLRGVAKAFVQAPPGQTVRSEAQQDGAQNS